MIATSEVRLCIARAMQGWREGGIYSNPAP